jgi:hypothetical protein
VTTIHAVSNQSAAAQIRYTKAVAAGFEKASQLAQVAAAEDSRWTALAVAAKKEATAFGTLAAATGGTQDIAGVQSAATETRTEQPIFTKQCQKALR